MADGDKRVTRSQATSNQSSWLGLSDYFPYGREARVARSPQPSPTPQESPQVAATQTFFPSPETNSLPPIPNPGNRSPHLNIDNSIMADGQALNTLTTALSGLQVSSRKPDLPPFDKTSIDKWIRRVESAYIRSGISAAVEKFAFIESKFPVDEDPAVDEFLFGPATDANWEAFCNYLKKRYGKTTRQKASAVLEPIQMDGRTPSQFFAKLKQSFDDVTFDDVVKEICLRQLPNDIAQTICKSTESLGAKEMMEFADSFFNPDGSRLHKKAPTVNSVAATATAAATASVPSTFSTPFVDNNNDSDVNAIRGRGGFSGGRSFNNNNNGNSNYNNSRSKSRGRPFNNNNGYNKNNNNFARNNNSQQQRHDPTLCYYHNKFGDKAERCDIGCAKARSGNGQSPRQQ